MLAENELTALVGRQLMIVSYVNEKLDVLNCIYEGYKNNNKAFYNRFLLFTAHVYFRSIVIDLGALFVDRNSEKQNLHKLYKNQAVVEILGENAEKIKILLHAQTSNVSRIHELRDKEYAHYDFPVNAMSFSLAELETINLLFETVKDVLKICGKVLDTAFDLTMDDCRSSLERLLNSSSVNVKYQKSKLLE